MFTHLYDEPASARFAALAELVRRKAPYFYRVGGLVAAGEKQGARRWVSAMTRRRILELRELGWSQERIAKAVDFSPSVVSKVCVAAGYPRRRVKEKVAVDVPRVLALRARGRAVGEIAAELGVSRALICRRVREWREEREAA